MFSVIFRQFLIEFDWCFILSIINMSIKMSRILKKHFLNTFCHQKWGGGSCGCGRFGRATHFWSQKCSKTVFLMSGTFFWHFSWYFYYNYCHYYHYHCYYWYYDIADLSRGRCCANQLNGSRHICIYIYIWRFLICFVPRIL